jgi:hypothetical protein
MLDMLPLTGFLLWCQLPLFSPQQGGWGFCSLNGAQDLSCICSVECWVSVHCRGQATQHQQSAGLLLSGGVGIQFLDRRDMTVVEGGAA